MNATTIDQVKAAVANATQGSSFRLALGSLNSNGINQSCLGLCPNDELSLRDVAPLNTTQPADSITVTGTGDGGAFDGMSVSATFSVEADEAALVLTATGDDSWRLASGFPIWDNSVLASLQFSGSPTLTLASYKVSGAIRAGLAFAGQLKLTGVFPALEYLFGGTNPMLAGTIAMQSGAPAMTLSGPLNQPVNLGFLTVPRVLMEACSEPVALTAGDPAIAHAFLRFSTTLSFSAQGTSRQIPLSATIYDPENAVQVSANLTDAIDAALDELEALVNNVGLAQLLPKANFELEKLIKLTDLNLLIDPSSTNKLAAMSLIVASAQTWELLANRDQGNLLAVGELELAFRVDDPLGARALSAAIQGVISIGSQGRIMVSAYYPDFQIQGVLQDGTSISVPEILGHFLPSVPTDDLPQLSVVDLEFSADPGNSYSFQVELAGDWVIPLDVFDFHLDDLQLAVNYDSTTGATTGRIAAVMQVAGTEFGISADHPAPGQGWQFNGQLEPDQSVDLAAVLNDLVPDDIELPSELTGLKITALSISWDTQTKEFIFNGAVDVRVTLGRTPFEVTMTLLVDSTANATTGKRSTSGKLTGELTLGTATFALAYEFNPSQKILSGVWKDPTNPLTCEDVATALGLTAPSAGGVELPDLGLTEAGFKLDYDAGAGESFTIYAQAKDLGVAFLRVQRMRVSQDSPSSDWGIAFGVACLTTKPSEFPVVGKDLSALDFLTIETAFFILASTPFQDFTIPDFPGLQDFPMQVNTGAAMGVIVDFASTATQTNPDPDTSDNIQKIGNLNTIVAQPKLLLELTLSTSPANINLIVDLKGAVSIPSKAGKVRLSNAEIIIKVDPLAITLEGSVAFPVGSDNTIEATGRLTIGVSEADVAFEVQGDLSALGTPMGFHGVHLTEIGVELGVVFEPPEVEVGLQGKFMIGDQAPPPAPASGSNAFASLAALPRDNEFAFIFGISMAGEVPVLNPTLISLYLAEVDLHTLVTALSVSPPAHLPREVTDLRASEVLLYWCDAVGGVQLPDGTWAYPGFGFNASVDLWGFDAHAGLSVVASTGITGDLALDPIHIKDPSGNPILDATGAGKATTDRPKDGSGLVGGVLDAHGDGKGTPPAYAGTVAVKSGGPVVHFSTVQSPYLDVDWDVVLFNTVADSVTAQVTQNGFTFDFAYKEGTVFSSALQCSLSGWTHLEIDFSFKVNCSLPVGLIKGVDLGPIYLKNADCNAHLVVDVGSKFTLTITAGVDYRGRHYSVPDIQLSIAPSSLEAITGVIVGKLESETKSIFKDLIAEAESIVQAGSDEAEKIRKDVELEIQRLSEATDQDYRRILKDGEASARWIERKAEEDAYFILRDANAILDRARQILRQVESAYAAYLADVRVMAREAEQEAKRLADEVSTKAARAARAVVDGVATIAKRATDAVGHAVKDVFSAIKHIF